MKIDDIVTIGNGCDSKNRSWVNQDQSLQNNQWMTQSPKEPIEIQVKRSWSKWKGHKTIGTCEVWFRLVDWNRVGSTEGTNSKLMVRIELTKWSNGWAMIIVDRILRTMD